MAGVQNQEICEECANADRNAPSKESRRIASIAPPFSTHSDEYYLINRSDFGQRFGKCRSNGHFHVEGVIIEHLMHFIVLDERGVLPD
jgi:hypothetical protein